MNLISRLNSKLMRVTTSGLLWIAIAAAVSSCAWLQDVRDEKKGIQLQSLKAPPGYQISLLATGVPKARHMAIGARGTLFVGSSTGNVYALSFSGKEVTNQRIVIRGLTDPSGVAFHEGALYAADRTRIVRLEKIEERLDDPGPPSTVIDGLPDKARHGARALGFGPDGKLYVSVGSPCNTCEAKNDEYGIILRSNADGSDKEVFARGIRNSVGFDWHPQTRELWFTENGQDELGPDRPNDELNRVSTVGENFGFPYCHDGNIPDPKFGSMRDCAEFTAPQIGLGAHTAALGMRFHTTTTDPKSVRALIARHGSHPPIRVGYDVVQIKLANGKPERMESFLSGFLQGRSYWGRPVDVLVLDDGSVLVSDDLNGAIYRVTPAL